ncbi:MAG TPA: VOC family protein [Woeseiaceae bacterium]|nr:VOC family protein [Woeseiaceae bacterium]
MIGYVTLGTNNFDKAAKFYDELFASMGAKRVIEGDTFIAWSTSEQAPAVSIIKPYDGKKATVGNGVMVALAFNSTAKVDALYKKAISLGATDEGKPGNRGGNFYAAYFRDLDGNKLNAFCFS